LDCAIAFTLNKPVTATKAIITYFFMMLSVFKKI
jgi:hypothetical protein